MLSKLDTWNEFDKSGTLKHCIHKDKDLLQMSLQEVESMAAVIDPS